MKFIVGSINERKLNIVRKKLKELFNGTDLEVVGHPAQSDVPETPYDIETFQGAKNRAYNSLKSNSTADYYIGLESGLVERYGHIYEEAWAVVINKRRDEWYGFSSGLKVPDYILKRMDKLKMLHGDVMALLEKEFGKLPNDTWGTYSGGVLLREISLEEALRNTLVQVIAPKSSFYKKK